MHIKTIYYINNCFVKIYIYMAMVSHLNSAEYD